MQKRGRLSHFVETVKLTNFPVSFKDGIYVC